VAKWAKDGNFFIQGKIPRFRTSSSLLLIVPCLSTVINSAHGHFLGTDKVYHCEQRSFCQNPWLYITNPVWTSLRKKKVDWLRSLGSIMVQTTKFRGELQEQILEMKHSFTRIFSLLISPSCLSDFILLSFLRSHILAILMYVGLILFSNVFFFFPGERSEWPYLAFGLLSDPRGLGGLAFSMTILTSILAVSGF
jgi:hypothetical protein